MPAGPEAVSSPRMGDQVMSGIDRIAAMCLLAMGGYAAEPRAPLAVFPINEDAIAQMSKQHPLASAEVNDPVYQRMQRYQGFWLRDLLKDFARGAQRATCMCVSAAKTDISPSCL